MNDLRGETMTLEDELRATLRAAADGIPISGSSGSKWNPVPKEWKRRHSRLRPGLTVLLVALVCGIAVATTTALSFRHEQVATSRADHYLPAPTTPKVGLSTTSRAQPLSSSGPLAVTTSRYSKPKTDGYPRTVSLPSIGRSLSELTSSGLRLTSIAELMYAASGTVRASGSCVWLEAFGKAKSKIAVVWPAGYHVTFTSSTEATVRDAAGNVVQYANRPPSNYAKWTGLLPANCVKSAYTLLLA